jgi:DNA-binding LacI/PurR family transcriptional regulator
MERRVTIRDIAKTLGYHHSTVSLALRGDARLPKETRQAVQKAARKMGYRPDPMVQALAAYRTAIKPAAEHGTLAWLTNEQKPMFGSGYAFGRYVSGATDRAAELGYRLEEFTLRTPGMTPRRMVQILQTRAINGVVVAPQPTARIRARIRLNWAPFSAVTIGYSLAWPPLHLVTNHQFNAAKLAYRKLRAFGYRRIGFCFSHVIVGRSNGTFLGGYLAESARWPKPMQIEPLLFNEWSGPALRTWFRSNRPEAIIFHSSTDIERAIVDLKVKVPEDVGMVCLSETDKGFSSINQNSREVGIAAVDLLVSMMHRNERGIPQIPRRLLIEGTWQEGSTIRRIHLAAKPVRGTSTVRKPVRRKLK